MKKYERTLVIPDPHSDPFHSNERFEALSNFIMSNMPDNIVQLGDFLNLDSISSYETNNIVFRAGHSLGEDLSAGRDAYEKLMSGIQDHNNVCAAYHKRQYRPRKIWIGGNHEDRVIRTLLEKPEFRGILPDQSLVDAEKDGWEFIPYKRYAFIDGVAFTHIPMNRRDNQPLHGEYIGRRVLEGQAQTTVFGHTHRFIVHDFSRNTETGRNLIYSINAGWFGDYDPDYIKGNENSLDWWSGLIILTHIDTGKVDLETFSMERIKKEYI